LYKDALLKDSNYIEDRNSLRLFNGLGSQNQIEKIGKNKVRCIRICMKTDILVLNKKECELEIEILVKSEINYPLSVNYKFNNNHFFLLLLPFCFS